MIPAEKWLNVRLNENLYKKPLFLVKFITVFAKQKTTFLERLHEFGLHQTSITNKPVVLNSTPRDPHFVCLSHLTHSVQFIESNKLMC